MLGTDDDRQHVRPGTIIPFCTADAVLPSGGADPVCYSTNPPTSGPHSSSPMPFSVLEEPAPKENLVHNMEHGGVVVWVNVSDARILAEIEKVVRDALDRRRLVVMTRYADIEPNTIALTSWTRIERLTAAEFTTQRLETFIAVHQRRFNPEGF